MSNRLFGFLVLLFLLAGLLGVSAVEPGCTPAPRKTSHGEIMVEWEDAKLLAKEADIVKVWSCVYADGIEVTNDNVSAVLNYGSRLYVIGRATVGGEDITREDGTVLVSRYIIDEPVMTLTSALMMQPEARKISGRMISMP